MVDVITVNKGTNKNSRESTSSTHLANQIRLPGIDSPVSINTIVRLKGNGNYTWIYFANRVSPILVTVTLKWFEDNLSGFVRVHKSEMINPKFIHSIDGRASRELSIILSNGYSVSISRRRITKVKDQLDNTRY